MLGWLQISATRCSQGPDSVVDKCETTALSEEFGRKIDACRSSSALTEVAQNVECLGLPHYVGHRFGHDTSRRSPRLGASRRVSVAVRRRFETPRGDRRHAGGVCLYRCRSNQTLVHDLPGAPQVALDTVVVMFLVAYLYWVGTSFLLSYLPHIKTSGDFVQRAFFSLASTLEYRTVFLSWFALLPLLQATGLARLEPILYILLPVSLVLGALLIAMAADGLGLMRVREVYLSAAVATGLAFAYAGIVALAGSSVRSPSSSLYLTLVIFFVNGGGFALAVLAPLSARYAGVRRFYERYGRQIVIVDMQLTMLSLAFLWLAVVGAI